MRTNARQASPFFWALLFGLAGLLLVLLEKDGAISTQSGFLLLSAALLLYLFLQIMLVRNLHSFRWLLNPAVMCSMATFMLGFGLTNFLYFLPEDQIAGVGVSSEVTVWMFRLMALVLLGAIAMWSAYWSTFAAKLGRKYQLSSFLARFLRTNWDFRPGVLVILVAISFVSRLTAVRLGVFGYSSDVNRLSEFSGITQYLTLASGLGQLALVVVALSYFSPFGRRLHVVYWFWGLLAYELIFGLLSGFKSQVFMPIVVVGVCMYMRQRHVPLRWVALVPVAIFVAYAVIEPFRAARFQDSSFNGTSIEYVANTMKKSYLDGSLAKAETESGVLLQVVARSNNVKIASFGIEYASNNLLKKDSPNFLTDIFFAPFYAVAPRAIFDFKPISNIGSWYRSEVLGIPEGNTSIAMGPFTYLYFAGGTLAVALGFFFIGIIQRILFDVFLMSSSAGAAMSFLVLLPLVTTIDSSFYSIIINLVRILPIALFLQRYIYRR